MGRKGLECVGYLVDAWKGLGCVGYSVDARVVLLLEFIVEVVIEEMWRIFEIG